MKFAVTLTTSVVSLFLGGYLFWFYNLREHSYRTPMPSFWLSLALPLGLFLLGAILAAWLLSDNFHNVTSGTVIDHQFTPAHMGQSQAIWTPTVITMIPAKWNPDDWALCIKDSNGHIGWLHFRSNVFARYPVGSTYPRN